eukprot:m.264172 g.264172  ORF g.264172 m.264172 type:complete len:2358 (+) comp17619_c0_seq2:153-7226(+)
MMVVTLIATVLALMVHSTVAVDCTLKYNDTLTLDLSTLAADVDYIAVDTREANKYEYLLQICSALNADRVTLDDTCKGQAACKIDRTDNSETALGKPDSVQLSWVNASDFHRGVVLTYNTSTTSVEIDFSCGIGIGEPIFMEAIDVGTSGKRYIFDWKTDRLCLNQDIPTNESRCTYVDLKTGDVYDLSPLIRTGSNYKAVDAREGNKYEYELNVCRSLVDDGSLPSVCNDAGICRRTRTDDGNLTDPQSLGMDDEPLLDGNGILVVATHFGSKKSDSFCSKAADDSVAKARIEFVCDSNAGTGQPVLTEANDDCSFVFQWRTVVACPVQDTFGDHCTVKDPVSGQVFDFNSLNKGNLDPYTTKDVGHTFSLNICGPLANSNCASNAAVCQYSLSEKKYYSLGASASDLEINDGIITLSYTNGDEGCSNNQPRKTQLTFVCTRGLGNGAAISYTGEDSCSYDFKIYTSLACPELDEPLVCGTTNSATGEQYDLTDLSRFGQNWQAVNTGRRDIYINVCQDLAETTATSQCPGGAAVCVKQGNTFLPFGKPTEPTFDSNGMLTMDYPPVGDLPYRTHVVFRCGTNGLGRPQLVSLLRNNTYALMTWTTEAACPITTIRGDGCRVADEKSGEFYNLNALKGEITVADGDDSFVFAMCNAAFTDPGCTALNGTPGVCYKPEGKPALRVGNQNDDPLLVDGSLTMLFENGQNCPSGGPSSTVIDFVCNKGPAGQGQGTLRRLSSPDDGSLGQPCVYKFQWLTETACASETPEVECVAFDDDFNEYDLSSLVNVKGNWIVPEIIDGQATANVFELNICRGLAQSIGDACSSAVGACQRTVDDVFSLGAPSAPKYDNVSDTLYIEYKGGNSTNCPGALSRSARVDFVCDPTAGVGHPQFQSETTCHYDFVWVSSAACSHRDLNTTCIAVDGETGDVFDLSSLALETEFSATDSGQTYKLQVCRSSLTCGDDTNVAACQTTDQDKSFSLGVGPQDPVAADGDVTITYKHGDLEPVDGKRYERVTIITLVCDPATSDNSGLVFDKEDTDTLTYYFELYHKAACPTVAGTVPCSAAGPGLGGTGLADYDLSGLTSNRRNYVVPMEAANTEIQINICRPLVRGTVGCSEKTAVCNVNTRGSDEDWGQPASPRVRTNGKLYIQHSDGAACTAVNATAATQTTLITFTCPVDSAGNAIAGVFGEPTFQYTNNNCVHHLLWTTSYACPVQSFQGQDCEVTDPYTADRFDFSSLKTDGGILYQDPITKTQYTLNFCGGNATFGAAGKAGRKVKGMPPMSLGNINQRVELSDRQLSMTFLNGDKCTTEGAAVDATWSLLVVFVCDPDAKNGGQDDQLRLIRDNEEQCSVSMEYRTPEACYTGQTANCRVTDPVSNATYDLTPLMKGDGNWIAEDAREDRKYSYIINVCRTLVPDIRYPDCGKNSSACQVGNADDTFLERDLGNVNGPSIDNGALVLDYPNGDPFSDGTPRRTRVIFECGPTVGEPIYLHERDDAYIFYWRSSAACSTNGVGPTRPPTDSGNCMVADPLTGLDYDLSALKGRGIVLADTENDHDFAYRLSVCENHVDCNGQEVGGCQTDLTQVTNPKFILGNASDHPSLINSNLQLFYTDGDVCYKGTDNEKPRTVLISFLCDPLASDETSVPVYVDETNDCTYVFQWSTPAACAPKPIDCVVRDVANGLTYDLRPLQRMSGQSNWLADDQRESEAYKYEINVCGPLVRDNLDSDCRGAAICQSKVNTSSFPATSLGNAETNPVLVNGGLVIKYDTVGETTSLCNGGYRRSEIRFECARGSLGTPVFVGETSPCYYEFLWRTSAACPVEAIMGADCMVNDNVSGLFFDLTKLSGTQSLDMDGSQLLVSLCDPVTTSATGCEQAGACLVSDGKGVPLGLANDMPTFVNGELALTYSNGTCVSNPSLQAATDIVMVCDPDERGKASVSVVNSAETCVTRVEWRTKYACRQLCEQECLVFDTTSGREYNLGALQQTRNSNWIAENNDAEFEFLINVCECVRPTVPPTGCDATAGVCQLKLEGDKTTEIYNLGGLDPASPRITASGLELHYLNGDQCGSGVDGKFRSTVIHMHCNHSASMDSVPVYFGEVTPCEYTFNWSTPAACSTERISGNSDGTIKLPDSGKTIDLSKLDISSSKVRISPFKTFDCNGVNARACINNVPWGVEAPSFEYSGALGLVLLGMTAPSTSACADGSIASVQVECGGEQKLAVVSSLACRPVYKITVGDDVCAGAAPSTVPTTSTTKGPSPSPSPSSSPSSSPSKSTPEPGTGSTTPGSGSSTIKPTGGASKKKSKGNTGVVAAAVIVSLVVVGLIVFVYIRRRNKRVTNYSVMASAPGDFDDDDFDES